jgi:hypothetical protein
VPAITGAANPATAIAIAKSDARSRRVGPRPVEVMLSPSNSVPPPSHQLIRSRNPAG